MHRLIIFAGCVLGAAVGVAVGYLLVSNVSLGPVRAYDIIDLVTYIGGALAGVLLGYCLGRLDVREDDRQ